MSKKDYSPPTEYSRIMSDAVSRIQDIEQKLAYVQWRKRRNERAIREILEVTKLMKQKDSFMASMTGGKATPISGIERDDGMKSSTVTDRHAKFSTSSRLRSPDKAPKSAPLSEYRHSKK